MPLDYRKLHVHDLAHQFVLDIYKATEKFLQFLNYSFGSGKEIEVLLLLSKDLGFLTYKEFTGLSKQLDHVMSKLFLFIRSVEGRIPGTKFHYINSVKRDSGER